MSGQLVLVDNILPDEQIVLDRSARAPAAGEVPPVRVAPGPHVGQDLLPAALHHHPRQVGLHAHHLDINLVPGDSLQHLVTAELGGTLINHVVRARIETTTPDLELGALDV